MSEPDNKTYRLETLADFWALGDADCIRRAFKEVGMAMAETRNMEALLGVPVEIPQFIEWTDDGGKFIDIGFSCEGEDVFSLNINLGDDFHGGSDAP